MTRGERGDRDGDRVDKQRDSDSGNASHERLQVGRSKLAWVRQKHASIHEEKEEEEAEEEEEEEGRGDTHQSSLLCDESSTCNESEGEGM